MKSHLSAPCNCNLVDKSQVFPSSTTLLLLLGCLGQLSTSRNTIATNHFRVLACDIRLVCDCVSDANCDDAFQVDSSCYKVHKNETVNWFTAVNRCLSNNASLAVFDDDVRRYFPSDLLTEQAWIGLQKSWWTWPGLSQSKITHTYTLLLCLLEWCEVLR